MGTEITRAGQPPLVRCRRGRPKQQSGAGASNHDYRNAPGHRGCLRPHRLCDDPAASGVRTAAEHGALPASGTRGHPSGRSRGAADRAGPGPGGPVHDRPVPLVGPGRYRTARYGPGGRGRPRSAAARTAGARASRTPGTPGASGTPRAAAPPATTPRAAAPPATTRRDPGRGHDDSQVGPQERAGRLRAGQEVRPLAGGQSGVGHLRPDVRSLRHRWVRAAVAAAPTLRRRRIPVRPAAVPVC
jgi:hypothetical protein